jgi:hypothetical protein
MMNGAGSVLRTLVGNGVNLCFAKPGTSEMHILSPPPNPVEASAAHSSLAHSNSSSSAFASLRSGVVKPSVNQP